jgi:hypothetical protein
MLVCGWLEAGIQVSIFAASVVTDKGKNGISSIGGKREINSY